MPPRRRLPPKRPTRSIDLGRVAGDTSLLDLVDNLLNNGVVLQGELVLGVAGVDLVYAQLSLMLAAFDRAQLPPPRRLRRTR